MTTNPEKVRYMTDEEKIKEIRTILRDGWLNAAPHDMIVRQIARTVFDEEIKEKERADQDIKF